jgi:chromosome partitioning protein
MPNIIAIANLKGGVAKTTTTAALAGALSELGCRVLAVDLDAQANLTSALGLQAGRGVRTVVDVLFNWTPLSEAAQPTQTPRLDLVVAHRDLSLAERFLTVRTNFEQILRTAAENSSGYDYVLLDCPPFLGAVTLNALNAANLLLIPTIPEVFSWESLHKTIRFAERVQSKSNPTLDYRVLICMLDARLRIHRELTREYFQRFEKRLFKTLIQVDTRLREAAIAGQPVGRYAPTTRSAEQYLQLAKEINGDDRERFIQPVGTQAVKLEPGPAAGA